MIVNNALSLSQADGGGLVIVQYSEGIMEMEYFGCTIWVLNIFILMLAGLSSLDSTLNNRLGLEYLLRTLPRRLVLGWCFLN